MAMIRKATTTDIPEIMKVVKRVVKAMNEQGSYQWDHTYPLAADYQKDVNRNELYLYEVAEGIRAVCTISSRGHKEYNEIAWTAHDQSFTLKRLAVDPTARGKGIANQFFAYAEQLAKQTGVPLLNTDTFLENQYAQQLFKRNAFQFVQTRKETVEAPELVYFEKVIEPKE
ncbi:hypothetical protein Pryu01_02556 [Paraliobacillus ryukyuensis]|uniref:N-acetylglutamate synthase-like GNAT family acetyltransferase n=2 Tax=Paraliobacillus ryukyuensis TaxID=200904 RepID=A0A366EBF7_9BACI|nr:N-acetylglutamate synthase-like GNAT family acetyltransferase [Paraliobacillus ryukyuensis]